MKAYERYLAVFDNNRKNLDRVPTFIQYVREDFVKQNRRILNTNFVGKQKISKIWPPIMWFTRFNMPALIGFDSFFASTIPSVRIKRIKVQDNHGKSTLIGESGQEFQSGGYYKRGYVDSLEVLDRLRSNMKVRNMVIGNRELFRQYNAISNFVYPILQVEGIFDRVWRAMGMELFSRHFKKNTKLYRELVRFYAEIAEINTQGIIDAILSLGKKCKIKVITLLDDVAYKGRSMISPTRWREDYLSYYKKITAMISDANLIPQVHTDGDVTQLVSLFQEAGFLGLQGWEGGTDPAFINENFPDFVVIGFGDVSQVLPFGTASEVIAHVKDLMDALKQNRHFIIGPSTVMYKGIPLENVTTFIRATHNYGKYS
ncbi:MAG: hypothetical protein JW776_05950 [Candidatus Lokiarchaeota archaeon]|nr:hypothetical protein [Candidatus Lokiarchaeota archaeon]